MDLHSPRLENQTIMSWVLAGLVALALLQWARSGRSRKNLPPSPKGYPILGNLLEVISSKGLLYKKMTDWAQEYGEILRLDLGPNSEYIINSDRACHAVFTANSAATSERPFWHVGQKYITNYRSMDLLDASNPLWKVCTRRYSVHTERDPGKTDTILQPSCKEKWPFRTSRAHRVLQAVSLFYITKHSNSYTRLRPI